MSTTQTQTQTQTRQKISHASSIQPSPRTVKGTIGYLRKDVTKPYLYQCEPPPGTAKTNVVLDEFEKDIIDLSGTSPSERASLGISTTEAGFQVLDDAWTSASTQAGWKAGQWQDKNWLEKEYYQDIDAILKRDLGVTSTFIFDHTVRKSQIAHLPDGPENRKPVAQAHVDQSRWAGENRIEKHLGQETLDRVKRGELKAQLINVWRPITKVEEYPLAMADSRTVLQGAWVESELRYETWSGQTLLIHHRSEHQWYYYKGLEPDQIILLKCYDSETETRTPHTAFVDPSAPLDAPPRQSIEVRVLCFTEK
ncbi:hypothetical protein CBS101457_002301 [Exobasidium rhododendri]|nr:hypothetical protein CBS101457_002301 [Exobasidium rhododendri]